MQRNASGASHLILAQPSVSRRSIARAVGSFTARCLHAVAESYLQSKACNPYWIGAGPLPESRGNVAGREERRD
jgi:hypothetical protein